MVPRQAKLGRSFKGAGAYYLHDKDSKTSERVEFTHSENIPTQDPQKALKWMAWTAIHAEEIKRESGAGSTGQPCEKPVFTFSLAWHPEQQPQKRDMVDAGRQALVALGLEKHETLMVAHNETDHPHLHLIVNTIHPETGRVNTLKFSKLKLSKWAEEYEREHGKIYCEQRVENNEEREQGNYVKYQEDGLDHRARITQLYHSSDSGKAFEEALAEAGYRLAQGKRIVVIDQDGKTHSLSRQIDGVKAKDIRAKLGDIVLQSVDESRAQMLQSQNAKERQAESAEPEDEQQPTEKDSPETVYFDRDQQDRDWNESIISASIAETGADKRRAEPYPIPPRVLNALQDRHLRELGHLYTENTNARLKLIAKHDEQYGAHERELRDRVGRLEHVLNNSGRVQRWWLKLTRQIPKNAEEELCNMRSSLGNIEWRKKEADDALESEIAWRRTTLEARHRMEKLEIEPLITPEPYRSDLTFDDFPEGPDDGPDLAPSFGP